MNAPTLPRLTCTYGPSCFGVKILKAMRDAGMEACRLNTAFGGPTEWAATLKLLQGLQVPAMLDLKGRQLRLQAPARKVRRGAAIQVKHGTGGVSFNHDLSGLRPKDVITLGQGLRLSVVHATKAGIALKALNAGVFGSQRVDLSRKLDLPALALTDIAAIEAGRRAGAAFLILSEVQSFDDVLAFHRAVRHVYGKREQPGLIIKIESADGVRNLRSILEDAKAVGIPLGVLLGRGDLRTEVRYDVVPVVQKGVAQYCRRAGVPLVVATKMLESMMTSPEPSQSDCSDVANAAWEGEAGVMLTDETAIGRYPIEATTVAAQVVRTALNAKASGKPYEDAMLDFLH
jgi:pyruvate kinase